jgi:Protein O-mannosyl-transferase TMEM260-like
VLVHETAGEIARDGTTRTQQRDVAWAAAAGLIALAVYIRTLAPGLTDDVDTAMFQFVGRVLGVPHNPGYPLYVLLTHAFSYLPIGSLAYRINLFSALFGALTVFLMFLVARQLGCRRVVSAAAALAFGFGQAFWSQSVIAEVYTLNAAIVAGVMLALLVWSETRRQVWYFVAVALFAAGLGNHTTIVGFAPGIALFVLLVDRRFVLRLRTLAATAAILTLGLLQYLFILLRSNQPGAYVESPAATPAKLLRVMLGGQFQDRLFAFGWHTLLTERVPRFIKTIFVPDMTWIGLTLAVAGACWLLWRRTSAALLLIGGGAAILVFALNYSVIDTPVFLIPSLLVAWLLAGVGAERVASWLPARAWTSAATTALCLAIPAWLFATNFAPSDRSRDTKVDVKLDRLFETLPDHALLVNEDFLADRMVMAKLLGETTRGRQIELAPPDSPSLAKRLESGRAVFAFRKSARRLRFDGLDVSFEPLRLIDGPLDQFLSRLPDGATVAIAIPAAHGGPFVAGRGATLGTIGGPSDLGVIAGLNIALVGVRGRAGAAMQSGRRGTTVEIADGGPIGQTGSTSPARIVVGAETFEAVIRQGDRELVHSSEGIVIAVWEPDGDLMDTFVLQAADRFQVPISSGELNAYRLRGIWTHDRISADTWTDVSQSFQSGSVLVRVASGEKLVLYLGDDAPMAPRVFDSSGRARVDVSTGTTVAAVNGTRELDEGVAAQIDRDGKVYRIELDATSASASVHLALGGIPRHAFGRVTREGASHGVDVFRVDTRGLLLRPDRRSEVLLMGRGAQAQLTGAGWSSVDWDDGGPFRWMTATEARVILPLSRSSARRIRVEALRDARNPDTTMRLRVNGTELTPRPLQPGWHVYEWTVPEHCMVPGINEASVLVERLADAAQGKAGGKGIAVSAVRVIHDES